MDNQNRRAEDKRAPGQLQWGESVGATLAGAGLMGTITAPPVFVPDIVMHGLRITKDGITYNGQEIKDAGTVHAALMDVLSGKPLPPAAPTSADNPSTAGGASIDTPAFRDLLGDLLEAYRDELRGGPSLPYEKVRLQFIAHIDARLAAPVAQSTAGAITDAMVEAARNAFDDFPCPMNGSAVRGISKEQMRTGLEAAIQIATGEAQSTAGAAKETPESMANSNARFAIDGAIQYGRENCNQPPTTDHWLYEYWNIGRQLNEAGRTGWDNVTPLAASALNPSEVRDQALEEVAQFFEMQDGSASAKQHMTVAAKLARLLATKPAGWAQQSALGEKGGDE